MGRNREQKEKNCCWKSSSRRIAGTKNKQHQEEAVSNTVDQTNVMKTDRDMWKAVKVYFENKVVLAGV